MHDRVKCEQRFEEALRDERIGVASGQMGGFVQAGASKNGLLAADRPVDACQLNI